jgi:Etoposide-induced protein 2.4 (EI24)
VPAHRARQNPNLFTSTHYRQAAIAVFAGFAIWAVIYVPLYLVRGLIAFAGLFVSLEDRTWDDTVIHGLEFIAKSVLQVPFFLMSVMGSVTPTLDQMFMDSLRWVDQTYVQKHKTEDPGSLRSMYYPNLSMYSTHGELEKKEKRSTLNGVVIALKRYSRRALISLGVYALTFLPVVGKFVLPAASFYTFNKAVGPVPAVVVFSSGLVLPKRYMVSFLQTYFASRSLMRQLLEPYFHRVRFTKDQKRLWFVDRSGVLFGFALAFTVMVKIPLVGVLIYGIAEASTAYLITKITEPPPPPNQVEEYAAGEVKWKNKHQFLELPLDKLDKFNLSNLGHEEDLVKKLVQDRPGRKFA